MTDKEPRSGEPAQESASGDPAQESASDEPAGEHEGTNRRQILIVLVAAALGLGLGVGAIAVLRDDGGEPAPEVAERLVVQGPVIGPLVAGEPDEALGQPAPVLQGETLGGETITTESGRPRMLVFLAHWCGPCEAEVGRIVRLADENVLEGIDVIGVSTAAAPERSNHPPSEWLRREEWPFPTVADTADGAAARAYGATDLPYFVFIDSAGSIVGRASGAVSGEDLTTIARALATGELAATTTTTTTTPPALP